MNRLFAIWSALAIALPAPLFAAPIPAIGPALGPAPTPGDGFEGVNVERPLFGRTRTLSTGEILHFRFSFELDLYDRNGVFCRTIREDPLPLPFHGTVFEVDPLEQFVLFNDPVTGDVFRVDLGDGSDTLIGTFPSVSDIVFRDSSRILINSQLAGVWGVHEYNLTTQALTWLVDASGLGGSEPIEINAAGDLFRGHTILPNTFSNQIYRWDADAIGNGKVATELDGEVLGSGFLTATDLEIDPVSGDLFVIEQFGNVVRVDGDRSESPVMYTRSGVPIVKLDFVDAGGHETFDPYQPAGGARIFVDGACDFSGLYNRVVVESRRPSAVFSGAGTSGAGQVDYDVLDAPPAGMGFAFYGSDRLYDPHEFPLALASLRGPLFLGLDPASLQVELTPILFDSEGEGRLSFTNPGTLHDMLAVQTLCLDASGKLAQFSSVAFL